MRVDISRVLFRLRVAAQVVVTIRLGTPLPTPSSGLPAGSNEPPSSRRSGVCLRKVTLLQVGFTESDVTAATRALLPHAFTLAPRALASQGRGLLSVALSLGLPPPAVSRHPAL